MPDTPQDIALDGRNPELKARILELVTKSGIEANEPFWWWFMAVDEIAQVLVETPSELRAIAKTVGTMGKKQELAQGKQQTLQEQQAKTAKEQKELAMLTASVVSTVSNENSAQWRRMIVATAGWAFGAIMGTHLFHVMVPWSPYNQAIQKAQEAEEALEIVEAYGSPLSAWSWVLNKSECVKQTKASGTNKCTVEL